MENQKKTIQEQNGTIENNQNLKSPNNNEPPKTLEKKEINFKERFDLSIEKWFPSMISIIGATALFVWAFFSLINPLENDILELKTKGITSGGNNSLIINTIFLESTDGINFSKNQSLALKNIEFQLKERKDLVLIVAGYSSDHLEDDQFKKAKESELVASSIKDYFKKNGISNERIFSHGYGHNVPKFFPMKKKSNAGLILIDIYSLMKQAAYGNILSVV